MPSKADKPVVFPFKHPSTILVAGPTGSGKTEFLVELLRNKALQPFPQRVIWVYGEWQAAYDRVLNLKLPNMKITFVKDFNENIYETLDRRVRNLVVLDDQMENHEMHRNGGRTLTKFFTQGSHHRNLTIVYIVQNLFHQAKSMRTISLNSQYVVLYKNPRDKLQIESLARQMYPKHPKFLVAAFEDATSRPFGYLVVDLKPQTPDSLRLRTDIFNNQGQTVYICNTKQKGIKTSHKSK